MMPLTHMRCAVLYSFVNCYLQATTERPLDLNYRSKIQDVKIN